MFAFIVLLIVAGACFYFYQRLTALEQEIRAEQAREKAAAVSPEPRGVPVEEVATVADPVVESVEETPGVVDVAQSLEASIVAEVEKKPGMKQPELYKLFTDINKKQLQKIVKAMADGGQLKREKQGNSYCLFPA